MPQVTMPKLGFTFIEVLIVVIIAGIMTGFAAPALKKGLETSFLHGVAREEKAILEYLRERAIIGRKPVYLRVDNENRTCYSGMDGDESQNKSYKIPQGINIESGAREIIFYPDGSVEGGAVVITHKNGEKIILAAKGIFGGFRIQKRD